MEILEDRGLSFMFPLLRIQSELWRQIQTEPSAAATFKWVKDKVDCSLLYTTGFIHILAGRFVTFSISNVVNLWKVHIQFVVVKFFTEYRLKQ